jgi:hypothetical protein
LLAILAWAVSLGLSLSFWPGIMIWDASRQYRQALSGHFDDWHPPLLEWIWRQFLVVMPGPGTMLTLQLGLYGAGLGFLAWRSWKQGHGRQAMFIAATGLFPATLLVMATITKDALMVGVLMAAFACFLRFHDTGSGRARLIGVVLIVIAACLRFNAFLAELPLLLLAMPQNWTARPLRAVLALAISAVLLVLAMPAANRLLKAERSDVALSLVIFDLGGITAQGGVNVFPPMPVKNAIAVNRTCYVAERWDSYSWWVDPVCPIRFVTVREAFAQGGINPQLFWIKAIVTHPIAYAAHRLAHWNIASQFLIHESGIRWVTSASDPNEWSYVTAPNVGNQSVTAGVWAVNATPLGWPCWWLAFSFALLVLGRRLSGAGPMLALAASAFLYELGYIPLSVAAELRYHCWPTIAALIAAVWFVGAWRRTPLDQRPGQTARWLAAAPLVLVSVLGLWWRLG